MSQWFDFGYGPKEFKRDVHVAWVVVSAYLIVRLPQWQSFTPEKFKQDCIDLAVIAVVAVLKSWSMRTPTDQPSSNVPPG